MPITKKFSWQASETSSSARCSFFPPPEVFVPINLVDKKLTTWQFGKKDHR